MPFQLQRLFLALQTSDKQSVETTDLTKSFGWDSSEGKQTMMYYQPHCRPSQSMLILSIESVMLTCAPLYFSRGWIMCYFSGI